MSRSPEEYAIDFLMQRNKTHRQKMALAKDVIRLRKALEHAVERDKNFEGVKALRIIVNKLNDQLEWDARVKVGRLLSGAQSDHGRVVHAIYNNGHAICGTAPGKQSVGWAYADTIINCPKCLQRILLSMNTYVEIEAIAKGF